MDMDSPKKAVEGIKKEDESSPVENPGPNLLETKDYQTDENFMHESGTNDAMQVYLDQGYHISPVMHIENEGQQSPILKSNSSDLSTPAKSNGESFLPIESDLNHDDMERRFFDYGTEEQRLSVEDYQSNDKKERTEDADHIPHQGNFLDNNVNATYNNEFRTEDSYSLAHSSLLTGNNNNSYEIIGDEAFDHHQIAKSPALDEAENEDVENASASFHSEKPEVHAEMDAGNFIPCTEMKEDDYSSVPPASENGGMIWDSSSLHSPQRNQNASPSPERQFSISAERSTHSKQSPHTHPSPRQERVPSPENIDKKSAPSPSSSRRKRSPSVEKHSGGRRRHSHTSPARQKSPSEWTAQRDSHHRDRDRSPRRHIAPSPQRRDSPRMGRSTSLSPVRRRDSPGRRIDHHRRSRSRSRSPHARDRHRRSPWRRPSPRRRSPPPSYSRRRSPRRPWSPPANRNTGLGKPGNNLFIAGFSYVTTERDLEKKFSRFGRVTDVRIVRDRRSGESRGFGFLSLERDEDADAAIRAVDQTEWHGRIVLVEKSKTATR